MKKIILLALTVFVFQSCEKDTEIDPELVDPPVPAADTVFTSDRARNLNVVYFIPNDLDTIAGYKKRISEYLLFTRQYYKDEMARNGYANKTFGLLTNSRDQVKIIVIRGDNPKASYPHDGGQSAIASEVQSYFAAHPEDNTSEHTLILLPAYGYNPDGSLQEGPFSGWGRWCFALDYEGMDMSHKGKPGNEGDKWTLYVGGMVHEVGHAFNLPHDKQKVSEKSTLGTALMHYGNYALGKSPTILTAADAAILNTVSVFNTGNKTYYSDVDASMTRIYGSFDSSKDAIILSGKFVSDTPVNSIVYYNDPDMPGDDGDYDAITWESRTIATDSFYVEMPIAELDTRDASHPYELRVKLVHENGTVTPFTYGYTFSNSIPVLTLPGAGKQELPREGWSIAYYSSQQNTTTESAERVLDNDPDTFWHSRWSSNPAPYPHELVVDMGAVKTINGISYTHREATNRSVKDIEILISTDGVNFTSAGNYVVPKFSGAQYLEFASEKEARYFKVICKTSHDGTENAAIAELGAF